MRYFISSFIILFIGLLGSYFLGGLEGVYIAALLVVLEVSLSFDNAVVNASVLTRMTDLWRHRFLTWGILIAVFGAFVTPPDRRSAATTRPSDPYVPPVPDDSDDDDEAS